jgi:hypothetical protein
MDMLYHLPFRDWMEINTKPSTQMIATVESEPENGGGDTGLRR